MQSKGCYIQINRIGDFKQMTQALSIKLRFLRTLRQNGYTLADACKIWNEEPGQTPSSLKQAEDMALARAGRSRR